MTDDEPILPRELTTISDEVRNVPPPPTALQLPEPYALRVADPAADAQMIAEWMNRPHLVETWEYPWPVSKWHRYLTAQLAGSYTRPFIGSINGKDIVYLELYRAAKDLIATRYEADPYDLGLHIAFADPAVTNTGIVRRMQPIFVACLLGLEPRCRRVMFDPDHRNAMARRACERGGCVFLGEHDMPNRRMALYALLRSPEDIPRLRET
ncbi:GNAT family N-acetyltransferase [Mycobacterium botniense]|uniref:Lysine N-acyltransferase MbtK n=1 Tax=Mycobacterium botniense TaxID=84962 RepID=A0A7I9XS12_9MYCO|nr:GNAT family N-acetyltransferase [Mycobacterium botniense]GFG72734.1 siderophore biosynthesis protein [Mycobacterium botniense]